MTSPLVRLGSSAGVELGLGGFLSLPAGQAPPSRRTSPAFPKLDNAGSLGFPHKSRLDINFCRIIVHVKFWLIFTNHALEVLLFLSLWEQALKTFCPRKWNKHGIQVHSHLVLLSRGQGGI